MVFLIICKFNYCVYIVCFGHFNTKSGHFFSAHVHDFLRQEGASSWCKNTAALPAYPHPLPPPICRQYRANLGRLRSLIVHQTSAVQQFATVWSGITPDTFARPEGIVHASILAGHGSDTDFLCV